PCKLIDQYCCVLIILTQFLLSFFFFMTRQQPGSPLFPYTTLFRSARGVAMLDAPVSGGTERAQSGELSIIVGGAPETFEACRDLDRKSTRLNSSHVAISYAVFCLKKKK